MASLAIDHRTLAAGIGIDHAADGGPIAGGQLRGKKQSLPGGAIIELIFDYTGLHSGPTFLRIHCQNAIHMAAGIKQ